jgi:hypothetical protein
VTGINGYTDESGFSKLRYAVDDAAQLAKALKDQHYTVDLIPEEQASGTYITKHLRNAAQSARGTLPFFFRDTAARA